jgi:hypothetical protein
MGELNYWTDLMTRSGVGWISQVGSEHKVYGKMASQVEKPDSTPPDYDTVNFPSKKDILLVQNSAVQQ